jgi:hypothetical protein
VKNLFLVLGLALVAAAPAEAKQATLPEQQKCSAFDQIELEKLPRASTRDPSDDLSEWWSRWAAERMAEAWSQSVMSDIEFRLDTTGGFVPRPLRYEVREQRVHQAWVIFARHKNGVWPAGRWKRWNVVRITKPAQARLNEVIESPCLWQAPNFIPDEVPLKTGGWSTSVDGPVTLFDIRSGARRWRGIQVSRRLGPPGELRSLLIAAAFGQPEYVDKDVVSEGTTHPLPSDFKQ